MTRWLIAIWAILAMPACKNSDLNNVRSQPTEAVEASKSLSGTDGKGNSDAEEENASKAAETGKDQESDKGDKIDPNAKPEDHTNVELENCFQSMPKDRDPGPFFKEVKVVSSWKGRQRTQVQLIPIDPPPPGLNICKSVLDECVICTPWEELKPEQAGNENACDDYAEQCAQDTGKECRCVRS